MNLTEIDKLRRVFRDESGVVIGLRAYLALGEKIVRADGTVYDPFTGIPEQAVV